MQLLILAFLLSAAVPACVADVGFASPKPGATILPTALSFKWDESGESPPLSDFVSYQVDLMAGGDTDTNSQLVMNLVPAGTRFGADAAQAVVQPYMGGDDKNAYYLRFTSVAANGGLVENFSPRFTLSGMTGTFPATVQDGIASVKSTAARGRVNKMTDGSTQGDGTFDVPYGEQTGLTRYAPMQAQPPRTITKKDTKPMYPASSITIAKSALGGADASITVTKSQTSFPTQVENTMPAASHPSEDMDKFLRRWRD